MAVSSRRRGRDPWVRSDRWRSHLPIRRAPQVSVLVYPHVFVDQPLDSVAIRFPDFTVTEQVLRVAMLSVGPGIIVNVVDWTAAIDDRRVPSTIGFFVELAGGQGITSHVLFSYTYRSSNTFFSCCTSFPSPRSRTCTGACARRVTIKQEYGLGSWTSVVRQTDHPARQIGDIQ